MRRACVLAVVAGGGLGVGKAAWRFDHAQYVQAGSEPEAWLLGAGFDKYRHAHYVPAESEPARPCVGRNTGGHAQCVPTGSARGHAQCVPAEHRNASARRGCRERARSWRCTCSGGKFRAARAPFTLILFIARGGRFGDAELLKIAQREDELLL